MGFHDFMTCRVSSLGTLLSAEESFSLPPVSDHLPQAFRVVWETGHAVEILSWNVMARGRAGATGRAGTALEGKRLTNNGLDCDETPDSYKQRLKERVLPVLQRWLEQSGTCQRVACLQEFPVQPLLQQEFLSDLRSKIPCLQMAVGSAWEVESMDLPNACVLQLVVEAGFAQLATHTNAVVWDSSLCERPSQVPRGPEVLQLALKSTKHTFDLMSFHLPFKDSPGGARYSEGVKAATSFLRTLSRDTPRPLIAAGDFNVQVNDLEKAFGATAMATQHDSAVFRGQRLSVDACVALPGLEEPSTSLMPLVEDSGGLWRPSELELFGPEGRDAFIEKYVAKNLHDDPRLWRLSDTAVASLGCWPFAEQPREVARLLHGTRSQKKRKLDNPLLGTIVVNYSDSGEVSPQ
ncbi:unnamed protein product [Durusdinium trenchii]|uniref:Nocturnin n=1 Tax=Durusdinium trenchii TaxID=1381693 RepID=A0ABP0SUQ6_9DINO